MLKCDKLLLITFLETLNTSEGVLEIILPSCPTLLEISLHYFLNTTAY